MLYSDTSTKTEWPPGQRNETWVWRQLREVAERLQRLGHEMSWTVVGEHIAHGQCEHCEGNVTVEIGDKYRSVKGSIYHQRCPGDSKKALQ